MTGKLDAAARSVPVEPVPLEAITRGDVVVNVRGESMVLTPERAVWWRNTGTLLIADPHFGKAATFRASGIPVPSGTTREALSRLRQIATRTRARRVFFLGDLLHARTGRSNDMLSALAEWRESNRELELLLVRGNHDRHAGDPPGHLGIECVDAPYMIGPFAMSHHPMEIKGCYVFAGHLHPGVRLYGAGLQRARLPCFVIGSNAATLPAFGDFTGLADVESKEAEKIYAIAETEVLQISIYGY